MAIALSELFAGLPIQGSRGSLDRAVSGIVIDSRRVTPGCLFFALPGLKRDGNTFIDEAIARGAVGVVSDRSRHFVPAHVTHLVLAEPRRFLSEVAQRFFGYPQNALTLAGVTGTNGKTTVGFLLRDLMSGQPSQVGLIGTVTYHLGNRSLPAHKTTPEAHEVQQMLAQMREAGCREAVLEVSSHGIDQFRLDGLSFETAIFTNLTRDHLDYHGDMESYFQVKARLFTGGLGRAPRHAIINLDDPYGRRLSGMLLPSTRMWTYTTQPEVVATLRARNVQLLPTGTRFDVEYEGRLLKVESPLVGLFNVSNVLAALAALASQGRDLGGVLERLSRFTGIPGRMERIDSGKGFQIFVDYAHTDDALSNVLRMLRGITPGRVLVVFGCGGNRDPGKRAPMLEAAESLGNLVWATSDNPRGEEIGAIFDDMRAGSRIPGKVRYVEDRRQAISEALDFAQPGDSLLIAGKGHETFQEFADTVVAFDDRKVVRDLLAIKRMRPDLVPSE